MVNDWWWGEGCQKNIAKCVWGVGNLLHFMIGIVGIGVYFCADEVSVFFGDEFEQGVLRVCELCGAFLDDIVPI